MDDDERFTEWAQQLETTAETEFADRMCEREHIRELALGFIGGIESERARVREIADRIEALCRERSGAPAYPSATALAEEVLALVKELRGE